MREVSKNVFLGSAFLAALGSSFCCILPVIAIAFGIGAFGVASLFETLRPYLLIIVFSVLAFSFYQTYFRREKCWQGCARKPVSHLNQSVLWLATIVIIVFALFPYYTGYIVSALDKQQSPTSENSLLNTTNGNSNETSAIARESQTRKTVVISVEGMTCEECASHLNIALKRIKGVMDATASYREKNVKVTYNPKQVGIDRIRQGIRDAGYDPQ